MTANPTLLSMPLAQNGQKNVIPETQATAGDGLFSQSTGFPAETSLPLGAGGVAPSREDFNGLANLLGGVAFYAQKGFTFNYDATQDYYTGCVVIDPIDGNRYECIADMAAGTIAPSADTAGDYWTISKSGLDREQIPAFNHRDVITTSGTYTAPVNGWYRITVKGGGGGGGGYTTNTYNSGGGGGEGGTTIAYEYMTAGDTATVVIGAGGTGGVTAGAGSSTSGTDGGDSSVAVNSNTYTGGGGKCGGAYNDYPAGAGGSGTIIGAPGGSSGVGNASFSSCGGCGGGNGGGRATKSISSAGALGGGGAGGSVESNGASGGDGYAWFEYFAAV